MRVISGMDNRVMVMIRIVMRNGALAGIQSTSAGGDRLL